MILDDAEFLFGIKIPQLNNAPLFAAVKERPVHSNRVDTGEVQLSKTHDLAMLPRLPFLHAVIFLVWFYLPHSDKAFPATSNQHLLVRVHKDCGTFCNQHAPRKACMRLSSNGTKTYLQSLLCRGNQSLSLVFSPRSALPTDGLGIEKGVVALGRVVGVVMWHATLGVAESDPLDAGIAGTYE